MNTALAFAATGAADGLPGPAGKAIPLGLSTHENATKNSMPAVIFHSEENNRELHRILYNENFSKLNLLINNQS